jgi:hypothetical protein
MTVNQGRKGLKRASDRQNVNIVNSYEMKSFIETSIMITSVE